MRWKAPITPCGRNSAKHKMLVNCFWRNKALRNIRNLSIIMSPPKLVVLNDKGTSFNVMVCVDRLVGSGIMVI